MSIKWPPSLKMAVWGHHQWSFFMSFEGFPSVTGHDRPDDHSSWPLRNQLGHGSHEMESEAGVCKKWWERVEILSSALLAALLSLTFDVGYLGAGAACWKSAGLMIKRVVNSNPGRSGRRLFFSRVNFVCWLLFGVRSTPVLLQWHIKDPGHSGQSAGGRLHLNLHTPLTQWSRSELTMPLCRHSVETYQELSSHATHQGTLGHSRLSLLSHCGLILA